MEESGNGSKTIEEMAKEEVFKGAIVNLKELQRQDGLIAEYIDKSRNQSLGVIPTFINANSDDEVRQILKHAIWKTTEEQDKCVQAIAVCRITGATEGLRTILDRLTARSAGLNGFLMLEAFKTLSQTTFVSKSEQLKKGKYDSRSNPASPIA